MFPILTPGSRRCKLDRHDFTGIFLGYTATDQNIIYLDLDSGVVKSCHHAVFDEAWNLQPTRPPAAQLLYDLGLEADTDPMTMSSPVLPTPPGTVSPITVPWLPPLTTPLNNGFAPRSLYALLPLRDTPLPDAANTPHTVNARAARLQSRATTQKKTATKVVLDYLINSEDMAMIYVSPDPYATVFEEELDLRKMNLARHPTAGLILFEKDNRILLASMAPGTPGARIARWWTRIRGAWLIQVDGTPVTSISDAKSVFTRLSCSNSPAPSSSLIPKSIPISQTRAYQSWLNRISLSLLTTNLITGLISLKMDFGPSINSNTILSNQVTYSTTRLGL